MIDLIASGPQYLAHLRPVWDALPGEARGAGRSEAVLVGSGKDLAAARRLGYRRIAYLEHGIGQSYSDGHNGYPGGRGRADVDLFLSPNETAAAMDRAAYPGARVEVVGDPRLDTLPSLEAQPGTVAISFHWSSFEPPEKRSARGYYRNVIPELAAAVPLIGHGHPRIAGRLERFYRRLGVEFVPSFDDVCRRASLYVCDNSSTIYEFASTGRPVVVLNAPWYRRHVEHGLRFWEAADVGLNVDEPRDLVDTVKAALVDDADAQAAREAALSIAYGFRSGAGQRAAAAIVDWLASAKEVAA